MDIFEKISKYTCLYNFNNYEDAYSFYIYVKQYYTNSYIIKDVSDLDNIEIKRTDILLPYKGINNSHLNIIYRKYNNCSIITHYKSEFIPLLLMHSSHIIYNYSNGFLMKSKDRMDEFPQEINIRKEKIQKLFG